MQPVFLILDPQHDYAISLIKEAKKSFGFLPVYLYSDRRSEFYNRKYYKQLAGLGAVESIFLDAGDSLPAIMERLKSKYDIRGIMPYYEKAMLPAAEILEHVHLAWNSPAILRLFRDKNLLKSTLRQQGIHVNLARAVRSVDEVYSQVLPKKFVIKPNDGFANRDIGFFTKESPKSEIEEYFLGQQTEVYILEEFLEGNEYAVNGQMNHEGKAQVLNIIRYERIAYNSKPNIYWRTVHVRRDEKGYSEIEKYTVSLMEKTKLQRCPFHAEIMLTPSGPSLIEVAARIAGSHYAYMTNDVHGGGSFDLFSLAAHYYLSDTLYAGSTGNWEHYDQVSCIHVDGRISKDQILYSFRGADQVEAAPEFLGWVLRPRIGSKLRRTVDLLTAPYAFRVLAKVPCSELSSTALRLEKCIQINVNVSVVQKAIVSFRYFLRRAWDKVLWQLKWS